VGLCWRLGGSDFFRQLRYFLHSLSVTSLQVCLLRMVFCWLRTGCDDTFRVPLARRAGAGGGLQAKSPPQPAARHSKRDGSCDVPIVSHQSDRAVAYHSSQGETAARAGNEPGAVPGQTHRPTQVCGTGLEQLHCKTNRQQNSLFLSQNPHQPSQRKGNNPLAQSPSSFTIKSLLLHFNLQTFSSAILEHHSSRDSRNYFYKKRFQTNKSGEVCNFYYLMATLLIDSSTPWEN